MTKVLMNFIHIIDLIAMSIAPLWPFVVGAVMIVAGVVALAWW